MKNRKGFTLMEILIVVLIIGVLAAIALPQYQKAILKSRYAALMPIAKSLAAGNEAYYMEKGEYATLPTDLDVSGQSDKYPDGTQISMDNGEYSYVLAKRDNLPMNYVVYQKHSTQLSGEIHCEADKDNTQAKDVCKSFGPTEDIGETLTANYLTYVLAGTGNGVAPTGDNGGDEPEEPTEPEPQEPQTPTCEGAAPTKQESCSSGCGKVTVTATCEEGEWVYPTTPDMSSCPTKPNDETVECGGGYTGNKTRTATCNSAGTAFEFGDWDKSACVFTGTTYGWNEECSTWSAGSCINSRFTAGAECDALGTGGCTDSEFSGRGSKCVTGWDNAGCDHNTFNSDTSCTGKGTNACTNSEFYHAKCWGDATNACAGGTFTNGSRCYRNKSGACGTAADGTPSTYDATSCCYDGYGGIYCPPGTSCEEKGLPYY